MKDKISHYQTGFTLVEVIVVISIIGMLSSIMYANYTDARASARDDIRKSSLKELQLALELYKAQNGQYPINNTALCNAAGNKWAGPGAQTGSDVQCDNDRYIQGLAPDYIAHLPQDPNQETVSGVGFMYKSDGNSYKVMVYGSVESKSVASFSDEFARCPVATTDSWCDDVSDLTTTYAVYSNGAQDW